MDCRNQKHQGGTGCQETQRPEICCWCLLHSGLWISAGSFEPFPPIKRSPNKLCEQKESFLWLLHQTGTPGLLLSSPTLLSFWTVCTLQQQTRLFQKINCIHFQNIRPMISYNWISVYTWSSNPHRTSKHWGVKSEERVDVFIFWYIFMFSLVFPIEIVLIRFNFRAFSVNT